MRIWLEYLAGAFVVLILIVGFVHAVKTPAWQDPYELPEHLQ